MTEDNPVTGRPYGGRDDRGGPGLPGERPAEGDEREVSSPSTDPDHETASRAAQEGGMTSRDVDLDAAGPGMPERVDAPDPADATDADPPGGSVANQQGRTPDR